jgi:hypothetical protein
MRISFLSAALFCTLLSAMPAAEPTPETRVVMKSLGRNAASQERPQARIFELAGKRIETLEDFKAAVRTLPRGTEILLDSSCLIFHRLPVTGSRATIFELQQFCRTCGVTFTYTWGYRTDGI